MFAALDGTGTAYRIWFTSAIMRQAANSYTNDKTFVRENLGLYAYLVFNQMLMAAKAISRQFRQPVSFMVCWDDKGSSASRRKLYPEYKRNRPEAKPGEATIYPLLIALREQLADVHPLLNLSHPGIEADDYLALIAQNWNNREPLTIISRDSDLLQLMHGKSVYQYDPFDRTWHTAESFTQEHGFPPSQWHLFKALKGDSTDNWPGVKGCGEVKALKIIKELGSKPFDPHTFFKQEVEVTAAKLGISLCQLPFAHAAQALDEASRDLLAALDRPSAFNWTPVLNRLDINDDKQEEIRQWLC